MVDHGGGGGALGRMWDDYDIVIYAGIVTRVTGDGRLYVNVMYIAIVYAVTQSYKNYDKMTRIRER